jgi:hypothetical protein
VAANPKSSRFRGLREDLDLDGGWEVEEAFERDISGEIWWVLGGGLKFAIEKQTSTKHRLIY